MKYRITGKTFEWKKELKAAGLRWNAGLKVWEGNSIGEEESFSKWQISKAIESGELRNIAADGNELARRTVSQYGGY